VIDLVSDDTIINTSSIFSPPFRSASSKANDLPKSDLSEDQFPSTNESKKRGSSVAPERVCPKCNQLKLNGDCSLRACKTCCVASTTKCSLPDHKRAKVGARKPYDQTTTSTATSQLPDTDVLEKINSAITNKCTLWISYDNNPPREITPHGFKEGLEGRFVEAVCFITNKKQNEKRSFYLHKVNKAEDHDWSELSATQPRGTLSVLFLDFLLNVKYYLNLIYLAPTLAPELLVPTSVQEFLK
jgi:hypothetical protein